MAKIHRYSLSHTKTSIGHISEIYEEKELHQEFLIREVLRKLYIMQELRSILQ
jgi:hypothetical protein